MKKVLFMIVTVILTGCYSPTKFNKEDIPIGVYEKAKSKFAKDSLLYATTVEQNHSLYVVTKDMNFLAKSHEEVVDGNAIIAIIILFLLIGFIIGMIIFD